MISAAGEKRFEALSHSLNVRISKEVMFNYKEITFFFSQCGETIPQTCEVKLQRKMLTDGAAEPNNLNPFLESV